jgi:hypothetical protein
MKYLCLAYYDVTKFEGLTEDDMAEIGRACRPHDQELKQTGRVLLQASLDSPQATTVLRPRNGKVSITDGPYVETKEQVGGFFLIEARDLNEAIQIASKHPAALMNEHLGWGIEVRPLGVCEAAEVLAVREAAEA